jgi:adenine deaminase
MISNGLKNNSVDILKRNIELAQGKTKGEILLKNGKIVNVFSGEVYQTNVLISGDTIVGIGYDYYTAEQVYDLSGLYLLPGLIDGHIHIESSLLNLTEFSHLLLLAGTTTIIADPHEITNVLGTKGIDYMLAASKDLPLDIFLMIPSCVPSTNMETTGGLITPKEIKKYLNKQRVLGLAEMMNFPGVVAGIPEVLEKIFITSQANKIIDGHCPRLYGKLLQAYVGAGICSDHECINVKEAQEKLRTGMRVMIREGTAAKNLSDLISMVNIRNSRRCFFVSDDKHPDELLTSGHMNATLRKAVSLGMDPVTAVQMATLNTAEYFRFYDRGAIAPGKKADIAIVDNLTDFNVKKVIKNGKVIVEDKKLKIALPHYKDRTVLSTMKVKPFTIKKLKVAARGDMINVIRIIPNQIITEKWVTTPTIIKNSKFKIQNSKLGEVVSDFERDILKLVVIERHKKTGNMGIGFVSGFGFKKGAIASSVAHDSHNIIVVGTNDKDIHQAIKEIIKIGGGFVTVDKGKAKASLALPIAGLMSDEPAEVVSNKLRILLNTVKPWGTKVDNPFITLSFLALPVIPELKLTDKGLVDVGKFKIIPLFSQ